MIASWMVYIVLVSAGVTIGAAILERALRAAHLAARPVWISAICLSVVAAFWSTPLWETPDQHRPATSSEVSGDQSARDQAAVSAPQRWVPRPLTVAVPPNSGAARFDSALLAIWLVGSLLTLGAFGGAAVRLRRFKLGAKVHNVAGVHVAVTENTGPLVFGIVQPEIVLPKWVLELDRGEQQLLVAHEQEHVRGHDPALLAFAALTVTLVPWNPLLWYMLRRLRQAVEFDCDRRVLTVHPDARAYAGLLISVASREQRSLLPVAGLAASVSSLEERFQFMTINPIHHRGYRLTSALAVAALVLAVTAMVPRPVPGADDNPSGLTTQGGARAFFEFEVDSPVALREGVEPKYPANLRSSGISGEVWAQFVVDETGRVNMRTFKALRSTNELFTAAVEAAVPTWRFDPAIRQGKKVKQVVQQSFVFGIPPEAN